MKGRLDFGFALLARLVFGIAMDKEQVALVEIERRTKTAREAILVRRVAKPRIGPTRRFKACARQLYKQPGERSRENLIPRAIRD